LLGDIGVEIALALQSDSSRSSDVINVSKLVALTVSLPDSDFVDAGPPRTISYGRGAGGGWYVSGEEVSRFKPSSNPAVSEVVAPSLDVKDSRSSKVGGH